MTCSAGVNPIPPSLYLEGLRISGAKGRLGMRRSLLRISVFTTTILLFFLGGPPFRSCNALDDLKLHCLPSRNCRRPSVCRFLIGSPG